MIQVGARRGTYLLLLVLFMSYRPERLTAQGVFGTISGVVLDKSGAAIPNATVTVTNSQTDVSVVLHTNSVGAYTAASLNPGSYSITAQAAGFSNSTIQNVTLDVGANPQENLQLDVGSSSEVVEITAESSQLETQESMVSQTISGEQAAELPLNGSGSAGRDPWSLLSLSAGVAQQVGVGGYAENNARINGGRPRQDDYLLDGTSISQPTFGGPSITPSPDTVAQIRVVTNDFSAEYGRVSGGIVVISTRSGTDQFHGSGYEYAQNSVLDAKNYFQVAHTSNLPYSYNEYGGTFGGPILRGKLFFFADYEGVRSSSRVPLTNVVVPNAAFRRGDLSAISKPLINPFTGTPYTNNQVPVSGIPGKILALYPLGNGGADPNQIGSDYYNGTTTNALRTARTNPRIDYSLGSKDHIFGAFHYQGQTNTTTSSLPDANNFTLNPDKAVTLGWTHIFSSSLVNDLRYGFDRRHPLRSTNGYGQVSDGDFGVTGIPTCTLPQSNGKCGAPTVNLSGYTTVGGGSQMLVEPASQSQVTDIVTETLGKQTLKFGGEFDKIAINNIQPNSLTGAFSFTSSVGAGNAFANFLAGYLSQSNVVVQSQYLHSNTSSDALFVQDDYHAFRKLTLNLGVRWQYDPSWTEKNNLFAVFNPYTLAWQVNGKNGAPRGSIQTHWKEFAPRLGFAFNPAVNTVIRGGYGITFPGVLGHGRAGDGNPTPNVLRTTQIPSGTSIGALPTIATPDLSAPLTLAEAEYNVYTPYKQAPEYSQQYNLNVEQQLTPTLLFQIGYVGSHGVHLPTSYSYNLCQTSAAEIARLGVAAGQMDGPYCAPGSFTGLGGFYGDYVEVGYWGLSSSVYNSLQTKLEKRASGSGLGFIANFTYSKLEDDSSSDYGGFGGLDAIGQDFYHRRSERSISAGDVPLVFSFAPSYLLPFGQGQKFLSTGWQSAVFGGFKVNAIYSVTSGNPIAISDGGYEYASPARTLATRPRLIGNPRLAKKSIAEWFNTAAYDWSGTYVYSSNALQPEGSAVPAYAFGNAPRFSGAVRGPAYDNLDFSLQKNFRVTYHEPLQIRLQADAFDALNHPLFAAPDGSPFSDYGQITSTRGNPRTLQFSTHVSF